MVLSYVVAGWQAMMTVPVGGIRVEAGLASRWPVIFGLLWIPAHWLWCRREAR